MDEIPQVRPTIGTDATTDGGSQIGGRFNTFATDRRGEGTLGPNSPELEEASHLEEVSFVVRRRGTFDSEELTNAADEEQERDDPARRTSNGRMPSRRYNPDDWYDIPRSGSDADQLQTAIYREYGMQSPIQAGGDGRQCHIQAVEHRERGGHVEFSPEAGGERFTPGDILALARDTDDVRSDALRSRTPQQRQAFLRDLHESVTVLEQWSENAARNGGGEIDAGVRQGFDEFRGIVGADSTLPPSTAYPNVSSSPPSNEGPFGGILSPDVVEGLVKGRSGEQHEQLVRDSLVGEGFSGALPTEAATGGEGDVRSPQEQFEALQLQHETILTELKRAPNGQDSLTEQATQLQGERERLERSLGQLSGEHRTINEQVEALQQQEQNLHAMVGEASGQSAIEAVAGQVNEYRHGVGERALDARRHQRAIRETLAQLPTEPASLVQQLRARVQTAGETYQAAVEHQEALTQLSTQYPETEVGEQARGLLPQAGKAVRRAEANLTTLQQQLTQVQEAQTGIEQARGDLTALQQQTLEMTQRVSDYRAGTEDLVNAVRIRVSAEVVRGRQGDIQQAKRRQSSVAKRLQQAQELQDPAQQAVDHAEELVEVFREMPAGQQRDTAVDATNEACAQASEAVSRLRMAAETTTEDVGALQTQVGGVVEQTGAAVKRAETDLETDQGNRRATVDGIRVTRTELARLEGQARDANDRLENARAEAIPLQREFDEAQAALNDAVQAGVTKNKRKPQQKRFDQAKNALNNVEKKIAREEGTVNRINKLIEADKGKLRGYRRQLRENDYAVRLAETKVRATRSVHGEALGLQAGVMGMGKQADGLNRSVQRLAGQLRVLNIRVDTLTHGHDPLGDETGGGGEDDDRDPDDDGDSSASSERDARERNDEVIEGEVIVLSDDETGPGESTHEIIGTAEDRYRLAVRRADTIASGRQLRAIEQYRASVLEYHEQLQVGDVPREDPQYWRRTQEHAFQYGDQMREAMGQYQGALRHAGDRPQVEGVTVCIRRG